MKRIIFSIIIIFVIAGMLSKCGSSDSKNDTDKTQITYKVEAKPLVKPLYFSGTINPYTYSNILSPVDGVVQQMEFHYGQPVRTGQVLFLLTSPKLQDDFQQNLSAYLKALDDYRDKNRQFIASENLRKLQFISDDDYYSKKNAREEAYMAMLQARFKLINILSEMGMDTDLDKYKKLGREKIIKTLVRKWDKLEVSANANGIALSPIGADGKSGGTDSKLVGLGTEVKKGQILVTIGNLQGISTTVKVSEIDVNKIEPGQTATITGAAFPGIELKGEVTEVDKQALSESSGLPTFPVIIKVAKLTNEQNQIIHVGMSAKIEIDLSSKKTITVPIKAVFEKNNKSYVNIQDPKTKTVQPVEIKTGQTTMDDVVVVSGVKEGDLVVYSP